MASHSLALVCVALAFTLSACDQKSSQSKTFSIAAHAASVPNEPVPQAQLPRVAMPTHYRLTLTIDPTKDRFSGHAEIDVKFIQARRTLFIDGNELNVSKASVRLAGGKIVDATYSQVDKSGVARLVFASEIPAGEATLLFDYDAPFNQSLSGLYKVVDNNIPYAFTQFENTDARRAFPSFDEPGFKTPFDVTIIAPVDDKVIANTRVVSDTGAGEGMMRWQFEPTKPLPTYLIALAVGPLDIVDGGDIPANQYRDHPVHLRGITAKGKGHLLKYALAQEPQVVTALENYFGVAYPFQKLDILAVPDFAAGAMENAGAITYREQLLLMDDNAPLEQKRSSLAVQAHETAHQWFGDLVTPAWWDDIWLNESFATWMEMKVAQVVRPDQDYSRETLNSSLSVMRLDELASARQIHQPVHNQDDIDNAFDDITYSKGAGVLAMFESYVGPDQWQKGIHAYLTKFASGNATAQDFIGTVAQTTSHPEIVAAFNNFINQPHIPLMTLKAACDAGKLEFAQSVYTPVGQTLPKHTWNVPLCVEGDGGRICQMTPPSTSEMTVGGTCPAHLFPNAQGAGYYRFGEDDAGWQALIADAANANPGDQITLFHNVDAAMRGGHAPAADYFAVISALAPSAKWDMLMSDHRGSFNLIDSLHDLRVTGMLPDGDLAAEQAFVRKAFGPRLAPLGLAAKAGEPAADTLMRQYLVQLLVEEGRDPQLIAQLAKAAHAYLASNGKDMGGIAPELLQEAMRAGVMSEGAPFAQSLLDAIGKSGDEYFIQSAIYAVAGSDDEAALNKLFDMALTPTIRIGDVRYVFRYAEAEKPGRTILWSWFKTNYDGLLKRVSHYGMSSAPDIQGFGCDQAAKDELHAFFAPKLAQLEGTPRTLAENENRIDRCMKLKSAEGAQIEAALKAAQ
ncbi:MAG TPA: M1 family metallopeptidase [Rhizomicrobium sp.]|jgi:alanyl aminopeptidase|nr:M1 family metallopeptidase [Rhizomicrobium sp.]